MAWKGTRAQARAAVLAGSHTAIASKDGDALKRQLGTLFAVTHHGRLQFECRTSHLRVPIVPERPRVCEYDAGL
jgi:hypothetical protein